MEGKITTGRTTSVCCLLRHLHVCNLSANCRRMMHLHRSSKSYERTSFPSRTLSTTPYLRLLDLSTLFGRLWKEQTIFLYMALFSYMTCLSTPFCINSVGSRNLLTPVCFGTPITLTGDIPLTFLGTSLYNKLGITTKRGAFLTCKSGVACGYEHWKRLTFTTPFNRHLSWIPLRGTDRILYPRMMYSRPLTSQNR